MKRAILPALAAVLLLACKSDAKTTATTEEGFPEPEPYACRVYDYYDYQNPVPVSEEIEKSPMPGWSM